MADIALRGERKANSCHAMADIALRGDWKANSCHAMVDIASETVCSLVTHSHVKVMVVHVL